MVLRERNFNMILAIFLLVTVVFTTVDIIEDFSEGESALHLLSEFGILLGCVMALGWIWRASLVFERRAQKLGIRLAEVNAASVRWRTQAEQVLAGLALAIDGQFDTWRLSTSEKEVGLLLLKGMAMKEIAEARGTSERTVRQQAQEVYRKSSLKGRAELAAFFLEDLLLPFQAAPAPGDRASAGQVNCLA